ncbi:MAG: response regulator transcription factor [Candidatus Acidiferrales bacterium]
MTEKTKKHAELRRSEPTAREVEIIECLAKGKSNKQTAAELGISVRTVEAHRRHIMQKLHMRSFVELLYYAMDRGIAPRPRSRSEDQAIMSVPEALA